MRRIKFFISCCVISSSLNAANIVDVYGVDGKEADALIKHYGAQVGTIESQFLKEMIKMSNGGKEHYLVDVLLPKKNELIDKIKKQYDFAYVQFDTISYPGDKDTHTTIEVIKQNERNRLQFIPKQTQTPPPAKSKHDIVYRMIEFKDSSMNLLLNNKLDMKPIQCPVFHCLPGFNHPTLKEEFGLFIQNAPREKELIIKTIQSDPLVPRREAAIFLTGFFKDPVEIISLLDKQVVDSEDSIRNSAMRVIAETMNKAKINNIDVLPFIRLLDSPFDTDRNKALLVLLWASSSASSKQLIMQKGSKSLIALLRLKQPNNHDIAYAVLKEISGKDLGANNVTAWKNWLDAKNKQ